jgi:hypothetical protein
MGQEKIVLQKDILKEGLDLLRVWFDSAPGHQNQIMPHWLVGVLFYVATELGR